MEGLKASNLLEHIEITNKNFLKRSVEETKAPNFNATTKSSKSSKRDNDSKDYAIDYDDEGDEEGDDESETGGGRKNTRQRNINVIKRVGITYAWGRWGKWSRCLNSCVQIRKRQCIKRLKKLL